MWDELGIARTADRAAIRRAYAARLKALDVDLDPAAFIRLRRAYEDALADFYADQEHCADDELGADAPTDPEPKPFRPLEPAPPNGPGELDWRVPFGSLDEFRTSFRQLTAEKRTERAISTLQMALAQGIVPLGSETEFVTMLEGCALADPLLTPDDLERIANTFGATMPTCLDSRGLRPAQRLRERAAAQRWYARIHVDARRGDRLIIGFLPRWLNKRTRVARAARDVATHNLLSLDLPALRAEAVNARRYAPWLSEGIDPTALEEKLIELERTLLGQEIIAIIFFAAFSTLFFFGLRW